MRFELWIVIITALFIINAYYDNFLTNIYIKNKKYVQIVTYCLIGIADFTTLEKIQNNQKNLFIKNQIF